MSIDKQKLQKLLWSEVASWKADCSEWKQSSEALGEFLGEKTMEEVALELLAENEALRKDAEQWWALVGRAKSPLIGYTGCVICGVFTDHGGLPCPKTRATADAAMGKGEQS